MADVEMKYENKSVTTVRGLEARSIAKWEKEGWEFVSQAPTTLLRTTIAFRRPKKHIPRWTWAAAAAAAVVVIVGFTFVAVITSNQSTPSAAVSPTVSAVPVNKSPAPTSQPTSAPTSEAVSDAEVVEAFQSFFAERASSGVIWGRAATKVTFQSGVVTVTFDPAASGANADTFNELAAGFDFPHFIATPVAFSDSLGNRLRPVIDSIRAVGVDGHSLGTIDAAGILALNGLSK